MVSVKNNTIGWAKHSQSKKQLSSMIDLGKNMLTVKPEDLDLSPDLVACLNGTINLRTGKLHKSNPSDLITMQLNATYDDEAKCPLFDSFINTICDDNADLASYLQRLFGYSLTAHTSEQSVHMLYGDGQNGKSTLVRTLQDVVGTYAMQANKKAFLKTHANKSNDLVELDRKRLVITTEIERGEKLDEAAIKQITGGDKMRERNLHEKNREFEPVCKVFFLMNYLPEIAGLDHGIWRRIHVVPLNAKIAEEDKDPQLRDKLKSESSGILNWMLAGASQWYAGGLMPPDCVTSATRSYRSQTDNIEEFINELCVIGNDSLRVTGSAMYSAYQQWCFENSNNAQPQKLFSQSIKSRGFKAKKVKGADSKMVNGYWGIELSDDS